ncbi:MAG: 5'-nucleotidase [Bacteroidota bacterium]
MGYELDNKLVVGVSSRALFNLEAENAVYEEKGLSEFSQYQLERENEVLSKGTAFPLVEALLNLNKRVSHFRPIEVVVMSRNSPYTGMRLMHSIEAYSLGITRLAFTGGESLSSYLDAYSVDLFLSKDPKDVQKAVDAGFASGIVYDHPEHPITYETDMVRFAFDADAVVFSDESELIYKEQGLEAFVRHEKENRDSPMNEGPFAKLIKMLSSIQQQFPLGEAPIRIGIVTARNSPAHLRVIKTLKAWGVHVDAAFFLGGVSKEKVLEAFKPHIFFDDQDTHVGPASRVVPSSRVPYRSDSKLNKLNKKADT